MPSIDVTDQYRGLDLSEFEDRVRDLDYEVGAIIDDDRGVIQARRGTTHEIEWEDEDCELIPGRVVSHNHPLGDSFSPLDVRLAWEFGARELRAVAPHGLTYVISAVERGWGDYSWDEIVQVGQAWADSVFIEIAEGRLTTSTPMDVIWKEACTRLDLTYSRESK